MNQPSPRVTCLRSLEAAAPYQAAFDALNLASRRPTPYNTLPFLEVFVAHDDIDASRFEVLLLVAHDGERLVGYLPLRRRRESFGPLSFRRVESLCTHFADRPQVVARPEDEARCADAFCRHLLQVERGFSVLEFRQQDTESPLLRAEGFHDGAWVRRFPSWTSTTILLPAELGAWWKARSANFRSMVGARARKLLAAGATEYVTCRDPRAARRLLELYVEVERGSWKARTGIAIGDKPRRVAFHRALAEAAPGCHPTFHLLLLDGRVVAALFALEFAGVAYWQELAYVEGAEDLSPGNLLNVLGLHQALASGLRAVNFGLGLAYYKERWGGVVTPTWLVQHFRPGSLPFWKALAGDLRRRLRPAPAPQVYADHNLERLAAGKTPRPGVGPIGVEAGQLLRELEAEGVALDRLAGKALEAALPFSPRSGRPAREAAPKPIAAW